MDERKLRKLTFPETEKIYNEKLVRDFAPEEVRPLANLRRLWEEGRYEAFVLQNGDAAEEGYAFLAGTDGPVVLLDYLAVSAQVRGRGAGSALLMRLKEHYRDRNFLLFETEVRELARSGEEEQERLRRDTFYRKNGGRMTSVRSRIVEADYRNWFFPLGEMPEDERVLEAIRGLYRMMLPGGEKDGRCRFWREEPENGTEEV